MHDMINKGRARRTTTRGEDNHLAKLTEAEVLTIRELTRSGVPQVELAARFGVTRSAVSLIALRRNWAHI
jgi:DNA-binding MarR family transcriptional regulator